MCANTLAFPKLGVPFKQGSRGVIEVCRGLTFPKLGVPFKQGSRGVIEVCRGI